MARHVELVAGVLSAILGLAGLAFAVFGQTYRGESTTVTSTGAVSVQRASASLWEMGIQSITLVFLAVMFVSFLLVALAAWVHVDGAARPALLLLWSSTLMLIVGTVLSVLSVGIFLFPGTLLALVAAIAGTLRSDWRAPDAA